MGIFKRGLLFVNILVLPVLILILFYFAFFGETIINSNELFGVVFDATRLDYHNYYFGFQSINNLLLDINNQTPNIIDLIQGYWNMLLNMIAFGIPRFLNGIADIIKNFDNVDYISIVAIPNLILYLILIFVAPLRWIAEGGIFFASIFMPFVVNVFTILGRLLGGYYNQPIDIYEQIVSVTPLLSRILGV